MHKQPLVLQGQAEATEIRISGKLPKPVKIPTARRMMTKAHDRVLLVGFIVCYGLG